VQGALQFAEPTGYGLGGSGWVSAQVSGHDAAVGVLQRWIDDSHPAHARLGIETLLIDRGGSPPAA
jgi:hypothetical protein